MQATTPWQEQRNKREFETGEIEGKSYCRDEEGLSNVWTNHVLTRLIPTIV